MFFCATGSDERRIKRVQRLAVGALYLISDNDHYYSEMIKPQDMQDVEFLGRCEIRLSGVFKYPKLIDWKMSHQKTYYVIFDLRS